MNAPTLRQAWPVWARIGLLSFGGPAGQIALMHRVLVDEKRWIDEGRFLHALNYCMILPGPEAMQLATYIGWLMQGWRGGLVAGLLFVAPGVVAIMALSWVYALAGDAGWVAAAFFGLKAAVVALVAQALVRIAGRALKGRMLALTALAAFVAIFALGVPFPVIVLAAALGGWLAHRLGWRPRFGHGEGDVGATGPASVRVALGGVVLWLGIWLLPVAGLVLTLGAGHVFSQIALYFSKMAVLTFGGAYAVLAWVAQSAVADFGWLSAPQMLDGLAMAETTPGPLIMVTQFVGFMAALNAPGGLPPMLAATLGGLLATWVTFAPCFLWIFAGAPFSERLRAIPALAAALSAVTAAVVGVIANLGLWFAIHALFAQTWRLRAMDLPVLASLNPVAAALVLLALGAVFGLRAGPAAVIGGAAVAGMGLHALGWV